MVVLGKALEYARGWIFSRELDSKPIGDKPQHLVVTAVQKIDKSAIDTLMISDSIPLPTIKKSKKIKVVSVGGLFAEAIRRIHF